MWWRERLKREDYATRKATTGCDLMVEGRRSFVPLMKFSSASNEPQRNTPSHKLLTDYTRWRSSVLLILQSYFTIHVYCVIFQTPFFCLLYAAYKGGSVAEWLACWTQAQKVRVQIAVATLSGNSLRQTVHTHHASVHQAAKLVAALLRVAGVTAGLAESNGSLPPGL